MPPPSLARWLAALIRGNGAEALKGDLDESWNRRRAEGGSRRRAVAGHLRDVLASVVAWWHPQAVTRRRRLGTPARSSRTPASRASQKAFLGVALEPRGQTRDGLLEAMVDRVTTAPLDRVPYEALQSYLGAAGPWSGSPAQLETRAAGLARLLAGSSEYQLV